jgi:RNA polymerase subunit RPABC4/transcription elongation factor Spt4
MPRKPTVSRKDAFFAQQQNSGKKSRQDSESEDSGFESDDIASDYEDQLEQNRDLKRRKRDEN